MAMILFYDGQCPLCVAEMQSLKRCDLNNAVQLEDIWQPDIASRFPQIDIQQANRVLHALDDTGQLLLGLDVTSRVWSLVGVRRYNWLRWPLIKPVADLVYRFFARHRYSISRLLTGRARICTASTCSVTSGDINKGK